LYRRIIIDNERNRQALSADEVGATENIVATARPV
jgi:hypothetical protein